MRKKTSKHRPTKRVSAPVKAKASPATSLACTKKASMAAWRPVGYTLAQLLRGEGETTASKRPKPSPATLQVFFHIDGVGLHRWRARRSGSTLVESSRGYMKKDKMKRTFLRLVESLKRGEWVLDEGVSK